MINYRAYRANGTDEKYQIESGARTRDVLRNDRTVVAIATDTNKYI